jgi:hypothetical protein
MPSCTSAESNKALHHDPVLRYRKIAQIADRPSHQRDQSAERQACAMHA